MGKKTSGESQSQLDELELVERIYKTALTPSGYDEFMDLWDKHVSASLAELETSKKENNGEPPDFPSENIRKHFEIGFHILEKIGRESPDSRFETDQDSMTGPVMLIDKNEKIVWYNGAADRHFPVGRQTSVRDIPFLANGEETVCAMVKKLEQTDQPVQVVQVTSRLTKQPFHLIARLKTERSGEKLICLSQAMSGWKKSIENLLGNTFSLTATEIAIARQLAEGHAIADIANSRNSSPATVRTQVKSIMSKTNTSRQIDLIRLLISMVSVLKEETATEENITSNTVIKLKGNRSMPVHQFGPENGTPVIFIHGMLDGCNMTTEIERQIAKNNIRLIAPERPCFGLSSCDPNNIESAPQRFAKDLKAVLDGLGIKKTVVMGHMAGAVFAFAAAARLKQHVIGVFNVAGAVPIVSHSQFSTMPTRQRLVAYSAKYAPKLMPFILRAGIRQLDAGQEGDFMTALYKNAPVDQATLKRRGVFNSISRGYHFTVLQGYRAFETDAWHVTRDWSRTVQDSSCPIMLIHGRHDKVVNIQSVERFAQKYNQRAKLIIDDTAGQLVLYNKPQQVFQHLDNFCKSILPDSC